MQNIKFDGFTFEQTQTILKIVEKTKGRCSIHYDNTPSLSGRNFILYEKTTGGLLSPVSVKYLKRAVESGEEDVLELLTETPCELWVLF
jgi:hypothetical protein